MRSDQLSFRPGFRLSVGNARSLAAVMVLPAGGKEGGPDNNHRGADQWLFVVGGTGAAIFNKLKLNRVRPLYEAAVARQQAAYQAWAVQGAPQEQCWRAYSCHLR
jgi:hypothetical protein